MSDQTLLMCGVGVTFIFVAGVYVFVRERLERGPREAATAVDSTRAAARRET